MTSAEDTYPLLSGEDLALMPAPASLVEGVVPQVGLTQLFGSSGAGKSFLALDLALSVATGTAWMGRRVRQGAVVFVATEGRAGLGARYRAWMAARGLADAPGFRIVPEAVDLLDPALVAKLQRTVATLPTPPALTVTDTVARSMVGGDENSAQDIGRFVAAVDSVLPAGARMVVHHAGHADDRERGSTALRAASDMVIRVVSEDPAGHRITVSCAKAKDLVPFPAIPLRLLPSADSVVLAPRDDPRPAATPDDYRGRVLGALARVPSPSSQNAVQRAVGGNRQRVGDALKALGAEGLAEQGPEGWTLVPEPRNHPPAADWFQGLGQAVPPPVPEPPEPPGPAGTGNGRAVVPPEGAPVRGPSGTAPEPRCSCPYSVLSSDGACGSCGLPLPEGVPA